MEVEGARLWVTLVLRVSLDPDHPSKTAKSGQLSLGDPFGIDFSGVHASELHALIGIKACKSQCLQQSDCLAIAYDVLQISCEIRFKERKHSKLHESSAFIQRNEIDRRTETFCRESSCRRSSCIVTRSSQQICRIRGCPECRSPPVIKNSEVVVSHFYNGAVARYTCHPKFSFFHGRKKRLRCYGNCTWETTDFDCMKELSTKSVRLPMPFKENTIVQVCGKIAKPKEFTISFRNGGDVYFEINPKFPDSHNSRLPNAVENVKDELGPRRSDGDIFPFRWFTRFCVTVTRRERRYIVTIKNRKITEIADKVRVAANTVEARSIELTHVAMHRC